MRKPCSGADRRARRRERAAVRGLRGHQLPLKSTEMDVLWKDAQKAVWVGERSAADALRAIDGQMQSLLTAK